MTAPQALQTTQQDVGRWRIWARRPGHAPIEVTWVRGAPTTVDEWSFSDPFGSERAKLTFSKVSMYDQLGEGELYWLAAEVDFDIEWSGPIPQGYPHERFVWEGYSLPLELGHDSVSVELLGALHQLDGYLAKPEYATNPLPYEVAIARCWQGKPDLRVKQLRTIWPGWTPTYQPVANQLAHFTPTGVAPGAPWTGMLTRETGSWEPTLTSYIQTLLSSMYTRQGRWTIDMLPGRRPVLHHRDFKVVPDASTVVIHPVQPGVEVSLSEDWSQSANVLYGQSRAVTGEAYSGQQVVGDGLRTVYRPLAALRQVEPVTDRNTWLDISRMRREQMVQVQEGLQADDLIKVGTSHLAVVSDPGQTGTITLTTDPKLPNGQVIPRHLIQAGMSVQVTYYRGDPEGVLLHISSVSYSGSEDSVTLTVDSKYRDRLTVDQVRLRGADALATPRMLITGRIQPLLPDSLFPWNYAEGSGYIPSAPDRSARRLFEDMPAEIQFPYEEWTSSRPPRAAAWRTCYIAIPPANHSNADANWAYVGRGAGFGGLAGRFGIPIRMAQAGAIRMIQIAAYDGDGKVMPVGFHLSMYYQRDVNVASMPKIPAGKKVPGRRYVAGQHHPFFEGAFETYNELGVQTGIEVPLAVATAGLIRGWGTQAVRAGHWPGSSLSGDQPTGLLVDEDTWEFNTVGQGNHINPFAFNDVSPYAGYLYCMIYCDEQIDEPVYFMGRMFRVEPGTQT